MLSAEDGAEVVVLKELSWQGHVLALVIEHAGVLIDQGLFLYLNRVQVIPNCIRGCLDSALQLLL